MAETPTAEIWTGRLIYTFVILALMFAQLLPLDLVPHNWAGPDLILVCTLIWVARRPEFVPVSLIAILMLLTDLLFQRPPGLWSGLVVILTEVFRARRQEIRNMPLWFEWFSIGLGIAGMLLFYRIVLLVVLIPVAPIGLFISQLALSVLVYPVVAIAAHYLLGVSRPALGAVNSLGHRL